MKDLSKIQPVPGLDQVSPISSVKREHQPWNYQEIIEFSASNYPWIMRVINILRVKLGREVLETMNLRGKIYSSDQGDIYLDPNFTESGVELLYYGFLVKYEDQAWDKFSAWVSSEDFFGLDGPWEDMTLEEIDVVTGVLFRLVRKYILDLEI